MDLALFDFELPHSLIAQYPLPTRSQSRLLEVKKSGVAFSDRNIQDITDLVNPGDILVMNDTRVIPARMYAVKPTGGKVEIMLERLMDNNTVLALLRANSKIKAGQILQIGGHVIEVIGRDGPFFCLQFAEDLDPIRIFQEHGLIPLPPYIDRAADHFDDDRYQTVYSRSLGAVAAPTAGLHFDDDLLERIENKGVNLGFITLHVGAGTFSPVKVANIEEHKMHGERIEVEQDICDKIKQVKNHGGRVIAVGTTVVRALESMAVNGQITPGSMETDIFITPGYQFQVIDGLITNFHLPKSTLLMMVSAFAGYEKIKMAYQHAIKNQYRFFSYGDAMFLERA
jgi:S-adenosylmethionine:tRNA ribosyltransferase-isomerase